MEEYLGANLEHEGKQVHKKLSTKAGRKKIYDTNNARNRDIYSHMRAQGKLFYGDTDSAIEGLQRQYIDAMDIEDRMIEEIDLAREEGDNLDNNLDNGVNYADSNTDSSEDAD